MTPVVGLDHVQIAAPKGCEREARSFYGGLLGLPEIEKPEPLRGRGGVWFGVGAQQLHVGVQEPFFPARKAHPALDVRAGELDALAVRLAEAGAEVIWDAELPGVRRIELGRPAAAIGIDREAITREGVQGSLAGERQWGDHRNLFRGELGGE